MNKKGFTLVELLAILAILGTIVAIAVPNISNQIEKTDEEKQNILNTKIKNASKIYAAKYHADKIIGNDSFDFTLDDLISEGLLDLKDSGCSPDSSNLIHFDGSEFDYSDLSSECYSPESD